MPAMEWGMGTLPPAPGLGRLPLLTFRFWLVFCLLRMAPSLWAPLGLTRRLCLLAAQPGSRDTHGVSPHLPQTDRSHRLGGLGREGFCGSRGTSAELSPHWEVGVAQEGGSQVLRPLWQRRLLPPGGFRGQRVGANMPEGLPVSGTPPTDPEYCRARGSCWLQPGCSGEKRVVFPCCVTGGESGDLRSICRP